MRNAKSLIMVVGACTVMLASPFAPVHAACSTTSHTALQSPPICLGTSGGSSLDASRSFCCGGTLGSAVMVNGALSILSNNHILARSGSATMGEDDIQPGLIDSGCRATGDNVVGDFLGNIVPLGTANVDVGISTARSGEVSITGEILGIGVPCSNVQAPTVGLAVEKSGRTTGLQTGSITSVNTSVQIQYQKGCNSGKKFTEVYTNQVVITPGTFSAGGDSGSLILSNDGTPNPVALLYAGSSSSTIGNPIQDVVSAITGAGKTFSFVGTSCAPANAPIGATIESATSRGPSANDIDFARTIKERHEPDLFAKPGVLGVGVGADEKDPTQAAIVIYVDNTGGKVAHGFPSDLDGVKVRIFPTDPFVAR